MPSSFRGTFKFIFDLFAVPAAVFLAFWFRFDWPLPELYHPNFIRMIIGLPPLSVLAFWMFGAYSSMWVYWSFRDLNRLIYIHTGLLAFVYGVDIFLPGLRTPNSIYLLYWFLGTGFLAAVRMAVRIMLILPQHAKTEPRKIIIIGAGTAGEVLARHIVNHADLNYSVAGFVDDDHKKFHRTIHGIRVLGNIAQLQDLVMERDVNELVLAIPSATTREMRRIIQACEQTGLPFRTVPGPNELIRGNVSVKDIRNVRIEDILGREQSKMDVQRVRNLISGKVIMVTGAAGSIGSELCRQILRFKPKTLLAVDKDENQLFYLAQELGEQRPFRPVVMQLQNKRKLLKIFQSHQPQLVFHAAAYKHVPCMEWFPEEAILNNFEITRIVMNLAYANGVEKFIQISTDKAVYPSNVMGASKRLCELNVKSFTQKGRKGFITVRFGNVIGSRGSVFTIFEKQIRERKPITITHPKMERYFMSIGEACRLVLEAASMGNGGGTYLLDMGEPIQILDLARQMIRLSGLEPYKDVPIITGKIRVGEKLEERLWYDNEVRETTANSKIYKVVANGRLPRSFEEISDAIVSDAREQQIYDMLKKVKMLIPEYQSAGNRETKKDKYKCITTPIEAAIQ